MTHIPSDAVNPELRNPTLEEQEAWFHEGGLREELKQAEADTIIKLARIIHHLTTVSPWIVSVKEVDLHNCAVSTLILPANMVAQKLCDERDNRRGLIVCNVGANPAIFSPFTINSDAPAGGGRDQGLIPASFTLPRMVHQHEMFCASALGTSLLVIEELL